MQAFVIDPKEAASGLIGAIATHEVRFADGSRLRKGQAIDADVLARIETHDRPIHAVRLDEADVHEDAAGLELAAMIAGPNVSARDPAQSRVNLAATVKGLLRVDAGAIGRINELAPIGIFTILDRQPVVPGRIVAGAKIATVAVDRETLDAAQAIVAARAGPTLEVKPFLPHRAGVIVTEDLRDAVRDRFETSLRKKLAWYGSDLVRIAYVEPEIAAVTEAFESLMAEGADLVLAAGGNMMDPLDPTLRAMDGIGASVTRLGAPAHPGSMFWLGEIAESQTPIVNLASCSMYSRSTVADLVLPWVMAGERVTASDIATLGYGGLLDRTMSWRFPDYDSDAADEE